MTTPTWSTDVAGLEVHVLGGPVGESVVLKLPDGSWGVVDCHARSLDDPSANPTIRFLRGRDVRRLRFVCLTHPHDDHFLGMSKLIEEFEPEEFWRFGGLSAGHVGVLIKYELQRGEGAGEPEVARAARELLGIFRIVRDRTTRGLMSVRRGFSGTPLLPIPSDPGSACRIECLSPTGTQAEKYEGEIEACLDADGRIARTVPRRRHNDISMVPRITYGKAVVILGGDLEREGWRRVVEESGGPHLAADVVKASHHGSENGYSDGLWGLFSARGKPVVVVTPRHRDDLPRPKALEHIARHTDRIYATRRPKAAASPLKPGSSARAPSIGSRTAVRAAFSTIPADPNEGCGRCGLLVDDTGGVAVELEPPALDPLGG